MHFFVNIILEVFSKSFPFAQTLYLTFQMIDFVNIYVFAQAYFPQFLLYLKYVGNNKWLMLWYFSTVFAHTKVLRLNYIFDYFYFSTCVWRLYTCHRYNLLWNIPNTVKQSGHGSWDQVTYNVWFSVKEIQTNTEFSLIKSSRHLHNKFPFAIVVLFFFGGGIIRHGWNTWKYRTYLFSITKT